MYPECSQKVARMLPKCKRQPECSQNVAKKLQNVANMSAKCSQIVANMWSECTRNIARMKGSLTLWDHSLLYIAFSIIGLSGKNEQKMKFGGRGVGQSPKRSMNHRFDEGGGGE